MPRTRSARGKDVGGRAAQHGSYYIITPCNNPDRTSITHLPPWMAILRRLGAPLQTRAALACQEAGLAGGSPLVRIDWQKGARYVMADPGCVGGCLRLSETASGRQKNEDRPTLTSRVHADHVFASSSRTDEEAKPRPDLRASPGFPSSVGQTRAPCFFASDFS